MTTQQQLAGFLKRFEPSIASLARRALAKMRELAPGSLELVYDNYNALVIGFDPTDRPSDAIFSIAVFPRSVSLCFLQGAGLPDPQKRLRGGGTVARHIVLDDAATLDEPPVRELIDVAKQRAKVPLDPKQRRRLIVRSISKKQRPRRPGNRAGSGK